MHPLRELATDLGALVWPVDCAGCGRAGRALCPGCREALAPAPVRRTVGGLPVVSGLVYAGQARQVVLALKNHGRTDLAAPLAAALRAALGELLVGVGVGDERVVLAPVPTTHRSRHERGFDPVRVVLRRARLPHRRLLALGGRARDQVLLDRGERLENAAFSMRAVRQGGATPVVLVDDVVTTGATLAEAARALTAAGWTVRGGVTIAAVPRHAHA